MSNDTQESGSECKVRKIHNGKRIPVLKEIGRQSKELNGIERSVTCPCGKRRNVRNMFQCLYCGIWFCESCAKDHFGEQEADL